MSGKIILIDMDGDTFESTYSTCDSARRAMRQISMMLGRSLRAQNQKDGPSLLGIGHRHEGAYLPMFTIRCDMVKSLRLLLDEDDDDDEDEDKKEPGEDDTDTKDKQWWERVTR